MDNAKVAEVFYEIADLLDLQGVAFKPQSYRRAARNIESLDDDIGRIASEGKLEDVPGVGEAMAKKIDELVKTGRLPYLEKLRSEVPAGLVELMHIPDVGPKTAMILYKELGIESLDQLRAAIDAHQLRGVKGFGEKSEERILQGIRTLESKGSRILLGDALPVAEEIVDYLKSSQTLDMVSIAGSLRRGKETIGDIDILVGDDEPARIMDSFVSYGDVAEVLMKGPTKSSVRLKSGLQVDIRAVDTRSFGAALQYFTGSKEHNVVTRGMGVKMGFKLNEYGLFERDSGKLVAGASEEAVYKALGLSYIEPELRENRGEIEAARDGKLPELVKLHEIRGDLHVHTEWSDGSDTIEAVGRKAAEMGYEWVVISDHSQNLRITNGLTPERLKKQVDAVRRAEEKLRGKLRILAGSEVDIMADGSLDFDKSVLKELDIVIGSVHSRMKMPKAEMTKRVTAAVSSGQIDILGHPTGRLIGQRAPFELELDEVLDAARDARVCMEINAFKDRLDFNDSNCRTAKDKGVRMAIGTDAHSIEHMGYMRLGVITARRGWLEPRDVLNTLRAKDLDRHLRGRR